MRKAAFLLVLATTGCTSSDWARTESVPGGKLYIPKLYAPLLPGSIYPDKKAPIPASARPAMVVVCPPKGDCREREILDQASQRGLVVLAGREPKVDLLRTRAEADPERTGWLLVRPTGDFLRRWMSAGPPGIATAIVGPPPHAGAAFPSSLSKQNSLLLAALLSAEPPEAKDGTVLKLYSPNENGFLPNEAFRDAVEWLAGALGAR